MTCVLVPTRGLCFSGSQTCHRLAPRPPGAQLRAQSDRQEFHVVTERSQRPGSILDASDETVRIKGARSRMSLEAVISNGVTGAESLPCAGLRGAFLLLN